MHYAARAWHSWRDSAGSLPRDARATRHAEQVRRHGNGPTKLEGKAAPLARRRLGEQRTPLERQLTGEFGRARLHGARASCRGAFSHPTEYINASGWLTTPRLEVLDTRPVAGAGSGIRQLKIGLGSARYCSAEEHTTPCTHGAPYGHVLAAPGGARRPPEPKHDDRALPPRARARGARARVPRVISRTARGGWLHFYLGEKRCEWFVSRRRTSTSLWHAPTLQGASAPLS